MRNSVSNIVVNSLDSSGFLNFDILVEDIRRQVLAPHLTIRCDHDLVDLQSSGQGPKFWQFFSDFLNVWGGVHFYPVWEMGFLFNDILHIFSRVNCSKIFFSMSFQQCILNFSFDVAPHSITGTFPVTRFCEEKTNGDPMMISWHDLSKIMLGHYVWGQFLSDQSLNAFKNQLNIFILCIYSIIQPKKTWKREKIQFFANDIMLGHLPFKWLLETGEAKTCKLDQYA